MNKIVYIYTLIDPISQEIRYVGKTENIKKRQLCHISNTSGKNKKVNWIKSLKKQNLIPFFEVIDEVEEYEWEFWEKYWISQCKAWGYKLTNTTDGGDGGNTIGKLPSELRAATIQKIKDAMQGVNLGRKRSQEAIENIISGHWSRGESKDLVKNKLSQYAKLKKGSLNPFFNKKHSEDSLNKMKVAKQGIPNLKKRKQIQQIDLSTGKTIKVWDSIKSAAIFFNGSPSFISAVCLGKRRAAYKFSWKYTNQKHNS